MIKKMWYSLYIAPEVILSQVFGKTVDWGVGE
jgi:hypothetical protein